MLVEGLDPDTILVSVRRMRDQDGILTYFNNDNEAGVNDCLKFPSGIYVPFSSDRFELTGIAPTRGETHQCNDLTGSKRPALHIHAALCHAGTQRTRSSNVYIDGHKVAPLPTEVTYKGCILSGVKNVHRVGSSRRRDKDLASTPPGFYGQLVFPDTCTSFPRSFPHGYTGMVNFCDAYSGERDFYFVLKPHAPEEVASVLKDYHRKNSLRPRMGKSGLGKPTMVESSEAKQFMGSVG